MQQQLAKIPEKFLRITLVMNKIQPEMNSNKFDLII